MPLPGCARLLEYESFMNLFHYNFSAHVPLILIGILLKSFFCPGLGNPTLPGSRIESRLVARVLVFERVVCGSS